MSRTPALAQNATPLTVVVRPRAGEGHDPYAVTLHPASGDRDAWEAYLDNGGPTSRWIGTVHRYQGSIDRHVPNGGRHLRIPGKRRTLWASTGPGDSDRFWGQATSRADAIRRLVGP